MKKLICVLLVILISISLMSTTLAIEIPSNDIQASQYLGSYSIYISPDGNGDISIWFRVEGTQTVEELGVRTIRLQEKEAGSSSWSTIETYQYTDYPEFIISDDIFHFGSIYYEGTPGNSYKAQATFWALGDSGSSIKIHTSPVVIAE